MGPYPVGHFRHGVPVNDGFEAVLQQMISWVRADEPFIHLRYADGEYDSAFRLGQGLNGDGCGYHVDTLGLRMLQVLQEVAALHPDFGRIQLGSDWNDWHLPYLLQFDLLDRLPIVACQVFVTGIESMLTMELLRAIRASAWKKVLVANATTGQAARCLDASLVAIPPRECWLEYPRILADCRKYLGGPAIFICCAAMPSEVLMWELRKEAPNSSYIDMGCFFDPAFGVYNRSWCSDVSDSRFRRYKRDYVPFVTGKT